MKRGVKRVRVSLALASYNGERFVKKQLQSILEQTVKPDEVVIIDDVSKDKTADIVTSFIAENELDWSFSVAEENSGYIKNFYNCLKKCTGDIIFLCDQDDEWDREKLEKTLEVFKIAPDCLGVNTSFILTDADGQPLNTEKPSKGTSNNGLILFEVPKGETVKIGLETVLMYNISPGCTCAFKREVVEEYIKTASLTMPHDWELNILAAKADGLYYLDKPLMGYRQHGGNAIGLKTEGEDNSLKMRGTDNDRLRVFKTQKAQAELIERYADSCSLKFGRFIKCFKGFCANREQILFEHRLWPCFKNLILFPKVKQVVTVKFRGLLGDIIYVLKSKR